MHNERLKQLARYKSAGKRLLIFDGADLSIVEVADSIVISCYLPLNTAHELYPFVKAVYRSFEHHRNIIIIVKFYHSSIKIGTTMAKNLLSHAFILFLQILMRIHDTD